MKIAINPRGNGACPLCVYNGKCLIKKTMEESLLPVYRDGEVGIVVYNCSKFLESNHE